MKIMRRGSVGSVSACCKAGPSSILGPAPQGGFSHWAERYCPAKKEGGREGYHLNRFDFLHHRRYFFNTHKGLISRRKLQKTVPAFRNINMWSLFWYGFRYQKLRGALRHSPQAMWRYSQGRHRICNERQSRATELQKYCFLSSYSTVRYLAIARLCLLLQLRWRPWEYRHMACSDLSNIQANLGPGPLLAISSQQFPCYLSPIATNKVAQCLNMPLSFW